MHMLMRNGLRSGRHTGCRTRTVPNIGIRQMIWFIVERYHGKLLTSLCYDRLPSKYQGKRAQANGLVAAVRIDNMPEYAGYSLDDLRRVWLHPWGKLK